MNSGLTCPSRRFSHASRRAAGGSTSRSRLTGFTSRYSSSMPRRNAGSTTAMREVLLSVGAGWPPIMEKRRERRRQPFGPSLGLGPRGHQVLPHLYPHVGPSTGERMGPYRLAIHVAPAVGVVVPDHHA